MNVLVLYAHPVETSFVAALHERVVVTLRERGHRVDDCDLNAEGFDPVLDRQERIDYHDPTVNQRPVAAHVARLRATEALVLVYPVWNFGFPAILKGYIDRVFLPGVAFDLAPDGSLSYSLRHIGRLAAVCTYGGERFRALLMSDPPRRLVMRMLRQQIARGAPCDYLASYDMNHSTAERRTAFLARVERRFQRW